MRAVLSDETYQAIRSLLLDHSIAPEEHIGIDGLSRDLDVSQTPVREALARLESDGLVVKKALRGYSATAMLTVSQVDDLFRLRLLIEPWAAERAAMLHDETDAIALSSELDLGRAASEATDEQTFAAMSEHDSRFHALISRLTRNDFVSDAFERTHCHLHLYRLYRASQSARVDPTKKSDFVGTLFNVYYEPLNGFRAVREHEAIADAILSRDGQLAEQRMRAHIQSSMERFSPTATLS